MMIIEIDWRLIFGIAGALVAIGNYLPYLIGVYKHTFRPHVFSWIIWSLMTGITFVAQLSDGAGPGAWTTGVTTLTLLVIIFFTLRNGTTRISCLDWISFVGALAAIPVWVLTGSPIWSVVIISVAQAMGFFPTFRKGYLYPHEESPFAFSLTGLKYALALLALANYSVVTMLFPVTLVVLSWSLVLMLMWRRSVV